MSLLPFVTVSLAAAAPTLTPITELQVLVAETSDQQASSITLSGAVPTGTSLPTLTEFDFPANFVLREIAEVNPSTGEMLGTAEFTQESGEMNFTNYTVTLKKSASFIAIFDTGASLFDRTQMGNGTPIGAIMLKSPSDLTSAAIGFSVPETGTVGAGDDDVTLLGNDSLGKEVYGKTFTDIKKGEVISATVAFGKAENRDAQLAEEEQEVNQNTWYYWFTTREGFLFVDLPVIVIIAAVIAIVIVTRRRKSLEE
jgi:hypothetical protein